PVLSVEHVWPPPAPYASEGTNSAVEQQAADDRAGAADTAPAVDVDAAPPLGLGDEPEDLVVVGIADHPEVGDPVALVAQVEPPGRGDLLHQVRVARQAVRRRGEVDEGADAGVHQQVDLLAGP